MEQAVEQKGEVDRIVRLLICIYIHTTVERDMKHMRWKQNGGKIGDLNEPGSVLHMLYASSEKRETWNDGQENRAEVIQTANRVMKNVAQRYFQSLLQKIDVDNEEENFEVSMSERTANL